MQGPDVHELFPDAVEIELTEDDLQERDAWRAELAEGPPVGDDRPEVTRRPAAGPNSARAAANRRWRQRNPDKVKEIQRKWREANKARLKESQDAYRERNPEKVKEWQKKAQRNLKARKQAANNLRELQNRRLQGGQSS